MHQNIKQESDYGFTLVSATPLPEAAAMALEYLHEMSGARLLFLKSASRNKSFTIGFRTPPTDSTGLPHILEHSVLAGSRKYRTREPFMDMLRTSMQTFLNAMTFEDMTLYPLSSQDNRDFLNLISVYLDAVFHPRIYETKEIFLQEGWHLALADYDAPLTYNGVVYNEMRGAYSDPTEQIKLDLVRALHPGSTYSHESGGYPYDIPQLRYEDFLAFHRRHYNPSNALIVLHGAIAATEVFPLLDAVLSEITPSSETIEIAPGERPVSGSGFREFEFNGEDGEVVAKNSWLSQTWSLGHAQTVEERFLAKLIFGVLVDSESSPLKLALRRAGLGEDVMSYGRNTYFTDFGVLVKNADPARATEFCELLDQELRRGAAEGFDRDLLLAQLNSSELDLRRSGGINRGIVYSIRAMSQFRYREPLLADLAFDEPLRKLREGIGQGLFEDYVKQKLADNTDTIRGIHRPVTGLYRERDRAVARELAELKAGLSSAEIEALIAGTEALAAWQARPDTPEEKDTLPYLSLSEIDRGVTRIEQQRIEEQEVCYLLHPQATGGIGTFALGFDLSRVRQEDLVYVGYLCHLLGDLSTADRDYIELSNRIDQICSGFAFSAGVSTDFHDPSLHQPRLIVRSHALHANTRQMFALLREILLETDFTDRGRLKELLLSLKSDFEDSFDSIAHRIAIRQASSRLFSAHAYSEQINGLSFYWHLSDLLQNFDREIERLSSGLARVSRRIFRRQQLKVSLTAEEDYLPELMTQVRALISDLPAERLPAQDFSFSPLRISEGLALSANVNYVTLVSDYRVYGVNYSGMLPVLDNLLSSDYLYQMIRARGGAYGQGISFRPDGQLALLSYRDPRLAETLTVYQEIGNWLRSLRLTPVELERLIIGSLNQFDPAISPYEVDILMLEREYSGLNQQTLEKLKAEAVATELSELQAAAVWLEQAIRHGNVCVVGDEERLNSANVDFDQITKMKRL
ncbi:MAG: insulinase family protein [Saccharofermentanales bacterium]|jgi:Zn-dependent M16 (insulinase) family peptidase|nr:insulinase family protein [Bacillota bacterium]